MIELTFVTGSAYRKVVVDKRVVRLLSGELGFVPLTVDLDKLGSKEATKAIKNAKMSDEDKKMMVELAKLGSERAIADDIKRDFQRSGWRLVSRK